MQREELLAAMAEIRFIRTRSFHILLGEASGENRGYDILIMTRYMTKEISNEIESLRHAGNKVEALIIPDPLLKHEMAEGGDING
jgi:vacuolar-type H+-ATPase subunit F/Vma7